MEHESQILRTQPANFDKSDGHFTRFIYAKNLREWLVASRPVYIATWHSEMVFHLVIMTLAITTITRHRVSTSTRWHFALGAMLSQQWNLHTDFKSTQ